MRRAKNIYIYKAHNNTSQIILKSAAKLLKNSVHFKLHLLLLDADADAGFFLLIPSPSPSQGFGFQEEKEKKKKR